MTFCRNCLSVISDNKLRKCKGCNVSGCTKCFVNGRCKECFNNLDMITKKKYDPLKLVVMTLLGLFFLLSMGVLTNAKIQNSITGDGVTIQAPTFECYSSSCVIDIIMCNNDELKKTKDYKLYFEDSDGKKIKKYKLPKELKKGCERFSERIPIPLFSNIKYGVMFGTLDLDPFINLTEYRANFSSDVSTSSDVLITDNNISLSGFAGHSVSQPDTIYGLQESNPPYINYNGSANLVSTTSPVRIANDIWVDGGDYGQFAIGQTDVINNSGFTMNDEMTISCIFNTTDGVGAVMGLTNGASYLKMGLSATGRLRPRYNACYPTTYGTNNLADGNLHQYTITFSDSNDNFSGYEDGVLVASTSCAGLSGLGAGTSVYLFEQQTNIEELYPTTIYSCYYWDRVLTPEEINVSWNDGNPLNFYPVSATSGFYNSTFFDMSDSVNNLTVYFNSYNAELDFSVDNGSSFYENVTSGELFEFNNPLSLLYNVVLGDGGSFSFLNFSLGVKSNITANVSVGLLNGSFDYISPSVLEGESFYFVLNMTDSDTGFNVLPDNVSLRDSRGFAHGESINGANTIGGCVLDSCLSFDGVDDTIRVNNDNFVFDVDDSFSFSFWFNSSDTRAQPQKLLCKQQSSLDYRGYCIYHYGGNSFYVDLIHDTSPSNRLRVYIPSANLRTGVFRHVVVSYDGSSLASGIRIYFDGVNQSYSVVHNNLNESIVNDNDFYIGSHDDSYDYFNGSLDEIVVYDKVLNSSEISSLYNAGSGREVSPSEDGVIGLYHANEDNLIEPDFCNFTFVNDTGVGGFLSYNSSFDTQFYDSLLSFSDSGVISFDSYCSKPFYDDVYNTFFVDVVNVHPVVSLPFISSVVDGVNNFTSGIVLSTYANFSVGNVTGLIVDNDINTSNLSVTNASNTTQLFNSSINSTSVGFGLLPGVYNVSLFVSDLDGAVSNTSKLFSVSLCSESWSCVNTSCNAVYPNKINGNFTTLCSDVNDCGTFMNLPSDNGSVFNCSVSDLYNLTLPPSFGYTPDKNTTAGVLLFFLYLALIIFIVVMSEVSKTPVGGVVVVITGFFFGYIVALQLSLVIAIMIILIMLLVGFSQVARFF